MKGQACDVVDPLEYFPPSLCLLCIGATDTLNYTYKKLQVIMHHNFFFNHLR